MMYAPTPSPVTPWTWSSMKRTYCQRPSDRRVASNTKENTYARIELGPGLPINAEHIRALHDIATLHLGGSNTIRQRVLVQSRDEAELSDLWLCRRVRPNINRVFTGSNNIVMSLNSNGSHVQRPKDARSQLTIVSVEMVTTPMSLSTVDETVADPNPELSCVNFDESCNSMPSKSMEVMSPFEVLT